MVALDTTTFIGIAALVFINQFWITVYEKFLKQRVMHYLERFEHHAKRRVKNVKEDLGIEAKDAK